MTRWIAWLALALAGCGGSADELQRCDEELAGWECDETCEECSCAGLVRRDDEGRGECLAREMP